MTNPDAFARVLAGLAMLDAYMNGDEEALSALVSTAEPGETAHALLETIEMMVGVFALRSGQPVPEVIAQVRARLMKEWGRAE